MIRRFFVPRLLPFNVSKKEFAQEPIYLWQWLWWWFNKKLMKKNEGKQLPSLSHVPPVASSLLDRIVL